MSQTRARVIAIGNQKGGVAKTTTAVQLAAALAEKGRRCLVWDLDMNCGSTQHFGIPDGMAILGTYEVMLGEEQPIDVIVKAGDEAIASIDDLQRALSDAGSTILLRVLRGAVELDVLVDFESDGGPGGDA